MRGILGQRLKNADSPQAPTLRRGISVPTSLPPSSFDSLEMPTTSLFPSLRFTLLLLRFCRVPPPVPPPRCTPTSSHTPHPYDHQAMLSRYFRPTLRPTPISLLPCLPLFSLPFDSLSLSSSFPLRHVSHCFSTSPPHCSRPHVFPPFPFTHGCIRWISPSASFSFFFTDVHRCSVRA